MKDIEATLLAEALKKKHVQAEPFEQWGLWAVKIYAGDPPLLTTYCSVISDDANMVTWGPDWETSKMGLERVEQAAPDIIKTLPLEAFVKARRSRIAARRKAAQIGPVPR